MGTYVTYQLQRGTSTLIAYGVWSVICISILGILVSNIDAATTTPQRVYRMAEKIKMALPAPAGTSPLNDHQLSLLLPIIHSKNDAVTTLDTDLATHLLSRSGLHIIVSGNRMGTTTQLHPIINNKTTPAIVLNGFNMKAAWLESDSLSVSNLLAPMWEINSAIGVQKFLANLGHSANVSVSVPSCPEKAFETRLPNPDTTLRMLSAKDLTTHADVFAYLMGEIISKIQTSNLFTKPERPLLVFDEIPFSIAKALFARIKHEKFKPLVDDAIIFNAKVHPGTEIDKPWNTVVDNAVEKMVASNPQLSVYHLQPPPLTVYQQENVSLRNAASSGWRETIRPYIKPEALELLYRLAGGWPADIATVLRSRLEQVNIRPTDIVQLTERLRSVRDLNREWWDDHNIPKHMLDNLHNASFTDAYGNPLILDGPEAVLLAIGQVFKRKRAHEMSPNATGQMLRNTFPGPLANLRLPETQ